jgi:hypothetical protein
MSVIAREILEPCSSDEQKVESADPVPQSARVNFDYRSLPLPTKDSIRLLSLQHKSFTNSPEYSLVAFTLEDAPPYDALSYVWGSNVRDRSLLLPDNKILYITKNLETALDYVLPRCSAGYLWIDQICMFVVSHTHKVHCLTTAGIDQKSIPEKNIQIPLMGKI